MRAFAPGVALAVAVVAGQPAAQAQAQAPVEGTALVMTNELGSLTRASPRGRLEPVRVQFRGAATRMDFVDSRGRSYALVMPGTGQAGWLSEGTAVLPLPQAQSPLVLDASAPCAGKGMFADCRRLDAGTVADRPAVRWRYRFSNNVGPGRTSRGEMWLDAETGLVLAYKGEGGLGPAREWRVTHVTYEPVADARFEPPVPAPTR